MALFDQWDIPTVDKGWNVNEEPFFLDICFDESGVVKKDSLSEIPEGTTTLCILIGDAEEKKVTKGRKKTKGSKGDDGESRYVEFPKGYIPLSVRTLSIEPSDSDIRPKVVYRGDWIPSSVTKLSIPSLPFPLSLVPEHITYLYLFEQAEPIEIDMVPPTIQYLYLTHSNLSHDLPNTIKELVLRTKGPCDDIYIKPTFTSPIQLPYTCSEGSSDKQVVSNSKLNIQSIIFMERPLRLDAITLPSTLTSLTLGSDTFNHSLAALDPLPPHLKYLTLPDTYEQPIYQNQHLPITLTHLELSIAIDEKTNNFSNDWLCRKGYLPPSITHLKLSIFIKSDKDQEDKEDDEMATEEQEDVDEMATEEQEVDDDNQIDADHQLKKRKLNDGSHGTTEQEQQEEQEVEIQEVTLPSALKILLPSSIQSICLEPDDDLRRSRITVIDRDDYYLTTPTPKIREGLKELVLPESFNQFIPKNTLPSTLESLSILNPQYNQPLNINNIPTSLTSFKCMSDTCKLDLSSYDSIRELKAHGDTIINYPHYLESLDIRLEASKFEKEFNIINKHLIKRLVIGSPSPDNTDKLLDIGFPNLEYLKVKYLDPIVQSKVLTSIQELDIEDVYDECDYLSPNIKDIHFRLSTKSLELSLSVPVNNEIIEKERKNYVPNQLPMVDNFFKIWRNISIKSIIMESFYESTRSSLRFNIETGTLDYMDRFPNYNIFVDNEDQLTPALLQFDKAQQMTISCLSTNLTENIPRSIQRLRCYYDKELIIPSWITDLDILGCPDLPAVKVPPSVTRLTLSSTRWQSLCEIPATVKYLSLDRLDGPQFIPPSVTHLTLLDQAINSLEIEIPSTVQKIEFKKLSIKTYCSLDIPSSISNRLVNGVFYIYSESNNKTTIPSNATHLFWADDHLIDNDEVNIPPSVHTLVLGTNFEAPIISLPPTITQMVFSGELQQPLETIYFPPSLKYLYFNDSFLHDIHRNDLPNGLTHLVFGNFGGQIESLPQSCHHLEFDYQGSSDLDESNVIPPQIKHLKFTSDYPIKIPHTVKSLMTFSHDQITFIDTIPPSQSWNNVSIKQPSPFISTTRIHLRAPQYSNFNRFIMPNRLGNNIRSIAFGDMFNQGIVKGTFPNSIEHLDFGNKFNQKLKRSLLPTSLLTLVLGNAFNQDLNDVFPSTLTEISLSMLSKPQIKSSSQFPPNLKKLTIPCYDGVLDIVPTSTINYLQFNNNIVQNATDSLIFPVELTPPNITTLILNDKLYIESYSIIPPTIKNIKLCLSMVPDTKIPCTIESVVLPALFNQSLDTILQTVNEDDQ